MGKLIYIVSVLVGIISGYVGNNGVLNGSFWNLLFWAGIGIAIGCLLLKRGKRLAQVSFTEYF